MRTIFPSVRSFVRKTHRNFVGYSMGDCKFFLFCPLRKTKKRTSDSREEKIVSDGFTLSGNVINVLTSCVTECYIATSPKGNLANLRQVLRYYPFLRKNKGCSDNVRITKCSWYVKHDNHHQHYFYSKQVNLRIVDICACEVDNVRAWTNH